MMILDKVMMMLFLMSLGTVLLPTGHGRFVGAFMIQSSSGSVAPSCDHQRTTNDDISISPPSSSNVCLHLSRRDDSDGEHINDENKSYDIDGSADEEVGTNTPAFDWDYLFECIYGEGGEEQTSFPLDSIDGSSSAMTSTGSIQKRDHSFSSSEARRKSWLLSDDGVFSSSTSTMLSSSEHDQQQQHEHLPDQVYVVMFPSLSSSQDGVQAKAYGFGRKIDPKTTTTTTQQMHAVEHPKGSGNNVILAFESYGSCVKFASTLSQSSSSKTKMKTGKSFDFSDPVPTKYNLDELVTLGERLGVFIKFVPIGLDVIPPSDNVEIFGLHPGLRETKQYLSDLFHHDDESNLYEPQRQQKQHGQQQQQQHEFLVGVWE
mmetsp:Transcript_57714/g.140961  ORF Transcript_57714/g.140961 Transcript_57714/m.140961 type:complete len:374 (-) Transcript_57714:146-1267(-)